MLHTSDKSRPFYLSKKLNKYVPDARAHVFFDSIDHILAIWDLYGSKTAILIATNTLKNTKSKVVLK